MSDGWKERLRPLDEAYDSAVAAIVAHIDGLDDTELRQLRADLECPTKTNCGWTLYAAADIAKMFVEGTADRRGAKA